MSDSFHSVSTPVEQATTMTAAGAVLPQVKKLVSAVHQGLPVSRLMTPAGLILSAAGLFVMSSSVALANFADPGTDISTSATNAKAVISVDVDGDGDLDLVTGEQTNKVVWYENVDGTAAGFVPHEVTSSATGVIAVGAGDFDKDGDIDIAAAGDGKIVWYANNGAQTFASDVTVIAPGVKTLSVVDVDQDVDLDLVSGSGGNVTWYPNDGSGGYPFTIPIDTVAGVVEAVTATDINNDSQIDVVAAGGAGIVWYQKTGGSFIKKPAIGAAATTVLAEEVEGPAGHKDLIGGFPVAAPNSVIFYKNAGSQSFAAEPSIGTADDATALVGADIDKTGKKDLVAAYSDGTIAWYKEFAGAAIQTIAGTASPTSMAVGDFDKDGDIDLAVAAGSKITIYKREVAVALTDGSATKSIDENTTAVSDFGPDSPALTYSLVGGADQSKFKINTATGVLEFVAAPNFEAPTDANGDNIYEVDVAYEDAAGASDKLAMKVTVIDKNDQPQISGTPFPFVVFGGTYPEFTPTFSDQDTADTLTFSIVDAANHPLPGGLSLNQANGKITGTATQAGNFEGIKIKVDDGSGLNSGAGGITNNTAELGPFTIVVSNKPVIQGEPSTVATEGTEYTFQPVGLGPGSGGSYLIKNTPSWATFSPATGELKGTPDALDATQFFPDIEISYKDSSGTATLPKFGIYVKAKDESTHDPVISGTPAPTAVVGEEYAFTPTATDADGDPLTFRVVNRPGWLGFDPTTGKLSGTPGKVDIGTYEGITLQVQDRISGPITLQPFSIKVLAAGSDTSGGDGSGGDSNGGGSSGGSGSEVPIVTTNGNGGGSLGWMSLLGLIGARRLRQNARRLRRR